MKKYFNEDIKNNCKDECRFIPDIYIGSVLCQKCISFVKQNKKEKYIVCKNYNEWE